jgi:hypothetical protein
MKPAPLQPTSDVVVRERTNSSPPDAAKELCRNRAPVGFELGDREN